MPKSKETISDSESGSASSEEEVKSKSKPKKVEKKKKAESSASENSESEDDSKSKKRTKKTSDKGSNKKAKKTSKADEEEPSWELGNMKRICVRRFKGRLFIDIREMYLDKNSDDLKPGKKGVCLNPENWRELVKVMDEVNETVKDMA